MDEINTADEDYNGDNLKLNRILFVKGKLIMTRCKDERSIDDDKAQNPQR